MNKRGNGILLHVTSLPSLYGIGDMGPGAYKFVDFLACAKQTYWQVLPLNPTDPAYGNSPYSSISAFAYNKLLISPDFMIRDGFLTKSEMDTLPEFPNWQIDYLSVINNKIRILHLAYSRFKAETDKGNYHNFQSENAHWLDDFAFFVALKEYFHDKSWIEWPKNLRDRQSESLEIFKKQLHDRIEMEKFFQYIAHSQWYSLKNYCNQKGIRIIGDIPIYVNFDSVDVWKYPELFKLDKEKRPVTVAGVPPDYFSQTGQRWGNPVYQWHVLKESGYEWWIKRIEHNLQMFNLVRIDHFRGFFAFWEIPASENTAINGKWTGAPGEDFFSALTALFPDLPIIAEDLGVITEDVKEMAHRFGFPGMKILMFAFGYDLPTNPYIPHNLYKNCIVYTGTHDNNTVKGWFENELSTQNKERLFKYFGRKITKDEIPWELIMLAMRSVADTAIFPMQDLLGLDEKARMNLPSTASGNWGWRLVSEQLTSDLSKKLAEMTEICGRGRG